MPLLVLVLVPPLLLEPPPPPPLLLLLLLAVLKPPPPLAFLRGAIAGSTEAGEDRGGAGSWRPLAEPGAVARVQAGAAAAAALVAGLQRPSLSTARRASEDFRPRAGCARQALASAEPVTPNRAESARLPRPSAPPPRPAHRS